MRTRYPHLMRYFLLHPLLLIVLFTSPSPAQSERPTNPLEVSAALHVGLVRPEKTTPVSDLTPLGGELTVGRLRTSERAWQQCQCFYRSGAYLNYYNFRNSQALGHTLGAGLFFEPLVWHRPEFNLSVRASLGLSYVSRLYHPVTNPNRNFGSTLNGMTGLGVYGRKRLSENLEVVLALEYRHLSNAGIKQPNQGLNVPSLAIGLTYAPSALVNLPDASHWTAPALSQRWFGRTLALWSMRVYPADDRNPETPRRMLGLNLLGGYRLTKAHALSTGLELLDDGYMWEQMKRANYQGSTKQATWLMGYELWQGHVRFTAHFGYNFLRPGAPIFGRGGYRPATYEKYSLLYEFNNGITMGVVVKAFGEDTKGFQLAVGGGF